MNRNLIGTTKAFLHHQFFLPVLFLAVYGLWHGLCLLSPLYGAASLVVTGLGFCWIFLLWSMNSKHLSFVQRGGGVLFLVVTFLSHSWWLPHDMDIRVWITPPAYTGRPVEPLNPSNISSTDVVAGSTIHIQSPNEEEFVFLFDGKRYATSSDDVLTIKVPEDASEHRVDLIAYHLWRRYGHWPLRLVSDHLPHLVLTEAPYVTIRKTIKLKYRAEDDFDVEHLFVRVKPKEASQEDTPIDVLVASPQLSEIKDTSYVELSFLPWAGREVELTLFALDGAGHKRFAKPALITLPERSFHTPFAKALIEEREKLLKDPSKEIRNETANVMAGIARQLGNTQHDLMSILSLRSGGVRLLINQDDNLVEKTASLLWKVAIRLEEGMIGLKRKQLANSFYEMRDSLSLEPTTARIRNSLRSLEKAGTAYFKAFEAGEVDSAVMQAYANASYDGDEPSLREHFQARLEEIEIALRQRHDKDLSSALMAMQTLIENLPTILPELDADQNQLAEQLATMNLLQKIQKKLIHMVSQIIKTQGSDKTKNLKKEVRKIKEEQVELLKALETVTQKSKLVLIEVRDSQRAMRLAVEALAHNEVAVTHKHQSEALVLLENATLILSEKMKNALAVLIRPQK